MSRTEDIDNALWNESGFMPRAQRHRRPKWKYPKWKRVSDEVRQRDSYTCQVCGWVNPYPYPHHDNRTMVLDHVIPLSRGGTNDIGNFQLLCDPCNTRKGARCG